MVPITDTGDRPFADKQGVDLAAPDEEPITCGFFGVGVTGDTQEPTLQGLNQASR
jgi:hypothetical protein